MQLLPAIPAVLWAISFHEFCHGYAALRAGDPTAQMAGRLSMNPMAHFDLWGTLCLLLFRFGWATPVPIDPRNFRHPKRDWLMVAFAGIAGNILSAVAGALIIHLIWMFNPVILLTNYGLNRVLLLFVIINLNFAVFNLIPIPPLDGSKLIYPLLPRTAIPAILWLERNGFFILMALIYFGVIGHIMGRPVMWAVNLLLP